MTKENPFLNDPQRLELEQSRKDSSEIEVGQDERSSQRNGYSLRANARIKPLGKRRTFYISWIAGACRIGRDEYLYLVNICMYVYVGKEKNNWKHINKTRRIKMKRSKDKLRA